MMRLVDGVPNAARRRYNREWLKGIRATEQIIRDAPIDLVPLPDRGVIKQQFSCHVEAFRNDLANGFDTTKAQSAILDITQLAIELIEEADKIRAEHAHPAYAR